MKTSLVILILIVLTAPVAAQFSKPVCLFKGVVQDVSKQSPIAAHVRAIKIGDDKYVRESNANSLTGEYLIVLDGNSNYRVTVTSSNYATVDTTVQVPDASNTKILKEDFFLATSPVALDFDLRSLTHPNFYSLSVLLVIVAIYWLTRLLFKSKSTTKHN